MQRVSRTALVTGANRGLGEAAAEQLAGLGYRVILAGRDLEKVEQAVGRVRAAHPNAELCAERVDIGSDDQVSELFARLAERSCAVEVLVNSAGVIIEPVDGDALSVLATVVRDTININTIGAFRMTQAALPAMNESGFGRVVNVSSGMGGLSEMGAGVPAYRISKAALSAVTLQMHHAAAAGVKVNAVCPGWVRTDMGGPSATRSISEGVAGIVWAATLPEDGPSGGFFRDGKVIAW